MRTISLYAKNLDSDELLHFNSLVEAKEYFGLGGEIRGHEVRDGRVIKNKYKLGYDKELLSKEYRKPKAPRIYNYTKKGKNLSPKHFKNIYIYDLENRTIKCTFTTLEELAKEENISKIRLRNLIYNKRVLDKTKGYSYQDDLMDYFIRKIDKPIKVKEPKIPFKPTYIIIDFFLDRTYEIHDHLVRIAKQLETSYSNLMLKRRNKELVNNRFAICKDKKELKYYKDMPKTKKKNPKDKKPKPDMNVNGDFIRKEPNKKAVRKGKLGTDAIKERLKKK